MNGALLPSFWTGFLLSATLIVAIGAQNAFVLRQGLLRQHVLAVVAFCALADAVLMAVGVLGLGRALAASPAWSAAIGAAGAAFLAAYGTRALLRAWRPGALDAGAAAGGPASRRAVLAQAAAFTLLNPHVYLDTVLLVGAVGAQQPPGLQPAFLAGASGASLLWFSALGWGARRLSPWFAKPGAWRGLDALIGVTMLVLATLLVRHLAR